MTEQSGPSPENQQPSPDQDIAIRGIARVVDGWRRWRIDRLENDITRLDDSIDSTLMSQDVNQTTAQYARIENAAFGVKEPAANSSAADRQRWVTKASHESKTDQVADDGTMAESLRPTTKSEQRTKRRVERAEAKAVRPSGVISDLHKIYDLPDKDAIAAQPVIPDRRPGRGNVKARSLVDESLRRANLLNDQPARGPEPKIRLGTQEHRDATSAQRLQEGRTVRANEAKRVSQAERIQKRQQRLVTKQVGYVERVASRTDLKAKRLDRKIDRAENRIAKKRRKISTLRSKLN